MKRQADNNRVNRAMEHIQAAVTNINSIKWENRTAAEERVLKSTVEHLMSEYGVLQMLVKTEGER